MDTSLGAYTTVHNDDKGKEEDEDGEDPEDHDLEGHVGLLIYFHAIFQALSVRKSTFIHFDILQSTLFLYRN